jgi:hypothetical protein
MKTIFKIIIFVLVLVFHQFKNANSQEILKGTVFEFNNDNKKNPLPFANVYWLENLKGTSTDENGRFILEKNVSFPAKLVISYVGYKNDTIELDKNKSEIKIVLTTPALLSEVLIQERQDGIYVSQLNPIKTEIITQAGLHKLACCNLSESFENSATVDVGYTDAVSGAKQIQLLGLAGIYSQLMLENMPFMRGIGASYGLNFVPGSWMESIQISKGTSSVINGYESITGQINVEYKKTKMLYPIFLNYYVNSELKNELNFLANQKVNDKLSTLLMGHGSILRKKWDKNNDGFMDQPEVDQINLFNRWAYEGEGYHSLFGVNFINENRNGGQTDFNKEINLNDTLKYGIGVKNQRFQVFTKNGFEIKGMEETSIGIQASALYHNQDAFFGLTNYSGIQKGIYLNTIFQSEIVHHHSYSVGFSYQYDNFEEKYNKLNGDKTYDTSYYLNRNESVPGVFAQYTADLADKLTIILGIRADFNSYYKTFYTPRFHLKWNMNNSTTFRASAGKGYRSTNVIAENIGLLASSRTLMLIDKPGLEEAWNYGVSFSKCWEFENKRKLSFNIDYYRTYFINQVVIDIDHMTHHIDVYNLGFNNSGGKSYSNSLQAEIIFEPIKRLNITVAGRLNDVETDYLVGKLEKPYISKFKGLFTLSYSSRSEKWMFDFTTQVNGKSRLPNIVSQPDNPDYYVYSPAYLFMLGQITRKFNNIDIYIGCENIGDYMQHNPIMAYDKPFSKHFDASMIWGPIMGRMFYGGLRWNIG